MTFGKTFFLHGPRHSSEYCKVLRECSEKYDDQRLHKEDCSSGKVKRVKSVKFSTKPEEVNNMAASIALKKRKIKRAKNA